MRWYISQAERPSGRWLHQDRHVVLKLAPGTFCVAVFDGHGTNSGCVDHAVSRLPALIKLCAVSEARTMLQKACTVLAEETRGYSDGSTCSIAILFPSGEVATAIMGDSPVVGFINEKCVHIGKEHNVFSNQAEREAAIARGATYEDGMIWKNDVGVANARALGDSELDSIISREPDIESFMVAPGRCFFIASDGFLDLANAGWAICTKAFLELIEQGAVAKQLLQHAIALGRGDDDATVVLCRYR